MNVFKTVQVLLGCKRTDSNIKNGAGLTAKQLAEKKNNTHILEMFNMATDENTCMSSLSSCLTGYSGILGVME